MKMWNEKKMEINSINTIRMNELEAIAQLVNAIHHRREELGWTQTELAEKVGLHQESFALIENGGTIPHLNTVLKLALVMDMKRSLHGMEEAAAVNV